MAKNEMISDLLDKSPSRRKLLRQLGLATVATGAASTLGDGVLRAQSSAPSVVNVLQFALNLEYLEAEFYTMATMGKTIDQVGIGIDGQGTPGATTGGSQVNFSNNLVFTGQVAAQIGNDERNHVTLLRTALSNAGVQPVAKPAINLAALGPVMNEFTFLQIARVFEDLGVSAYAYAAGVPTVAASPYIGTAAQILAAEAEHVGSIRLQVARLAVGTTAVDGVDIIPPPSGTLYSSINSSTGLVATRSPGQVLFVAYGGAPNATSGAFFPNGLNGTIKQASASAAS